MTAVRATKFDYLPKNGLIGERQKSSSHRILWVTNKIAKHEDCEKEFYYQTENPKIYYEAKTIEISIESYTITLPHNLKELADSILDSRSLLKLEDDWDEEGADATNFRTYENAIKFLVNYSSYIFYQFNSVIQKPYIDITRDGSISVFWNAPKASFFIIFGKDKNDYAYYYGQEKETNISFKYKIDINDSIDLITLTWMRQNLL